MGPLGPRADLLDAGDAWQLRLEVPGVDQSRLELALQGDELVIAGIRETLGDGVRPVFVERPPARSSAWCGCRVRSTPTP
jgi:HSP20 family molecular chaperone IbpA